MNASAFAELDPYGVHRVLEPLGVLPQQAWRLDNRRTIAANEIRCDLEWLNVDAASFRQIRESTDGTEAAIAQHCLAIVAERGKLHNEITGSGGIFIGTVAEIGSAITGQVQLNMGDRIASLVSLTLTPLHLDEIIGVDLVHGRLRVRGHGILFASSLWSHLPEDLPITAALSLFDIAGAPAHVSRLAQPGMTVLVVGADGKSGLLSCAAACAEVGYQGRVLGVVPDASSAGARHLQETALAEVIEVDARDSLAMYAAVSRQVSELPQLVINCVNVAGTELSAILCTRERGTVCFFCMATSFSVATLGAEGLGRDVNLVMGSGYIRGHIAHARQTLAAFPALERYFIAMYGNHVAETPSSTQP